MMAGNLTTSKEMLDDFDINISSKSHDQSPSEFYIPSKKVQRCLGGAVGWASDSGLISGS